MSTATVKLEGRLGNNFYQIAHCIAYALKHGITYYIPERSQHMVGKKNLFNVRSTGSAPEDHNDVMEPCKDGKAWFEEIPKINNPLFRGYWQSFKYIDDYRDEILKAFGLPYRIYHGIVSIHIRRGDFKDLPMFKVMPMQYYKNCIDYFINKGYDNFYIFSDEIPWCRDYFTKDRYPECTFFFVEGGQELDDFTYMSCCEHNICANSSFSFAAAWLNQNANKIVLCPPAADMWYNKDMVPDYFTQIEY